MCYIVQTAVVIVQLVQVFIINALLAVLLWSYKEQYAKYIAIQATFLYQEYAHYAQAAKNALEPLLLVLLVHQELIYTQVPV